MDNVFIIAEAGVNHNGDIRLAKKLVDISVAAGADAVKFQTFMADEIATEHACKADYQKITTDENESYLEMLRRLELSEQQHVLLKDYCNNNNIMFMSSPFDLASIDLLNRIGLQIFKIPSGEITNLPYLRKLGALRKKVILSTGYAKLPEIKAALQILNENGTRKKDITLLHCTSEYPAPMNEVNLLAMTTLKKTFGVKVGYSDHTLGVEISIAAVALGAKVIEKHITLDKTMDGPDHKASLEPDELKKLVSSIRNVEKALGSGIKAPSISELKNILLARKSIVAAKDIRRFTPLDGNNMTLKRPGTGISPMKWDMIVGHKAKRDFKRNELIEI